MGYRALWLGLERQIDTDAARGLFHAARPRHVALHGCESLKAASLARSDGVLAALVTEYARTRHPAWAAAVATAMRPMLITLARRIDRAGADSDSTSMVLLALLEVSARTRAPKRRLRLRLYSETRRRVVRSAIAECRRHAPLTTDDVDEIDPDGAEGEVETVLDRARFVRSIAVKAPRPDESVARYVARLRRRPRELAPELAHHRRRHLDELRDALTRVG
jgi:hypothetical protein